VMEGKGRRVWSFSDNLGSFRANRSYSQIFQENGGVLAKREILYP